MIKMTSQAIDQVKNLIKQDKESDKVVGLRILIKRGGCAGLSYKLDFEKKAVEEKDKVFEYDGVKLIVDDQSFLYLIGCTLDFDGGLNGQGFIFDNPNASKGCGCGSSFGV